METIQGYRFGLRSQGRNLLNWTRNNQVLHPVAIIFSRTGVDPRTYTVVLDENSFGIRIWQGPDSSSSARIIINVTVI